MGQRSRTETVAAIMASFLVRRSWAQAELAREVDVGTETLRKVLGELRAAGIPLESERDPPHVYWSLPKSWFPGGILFKQDVVPELLRQLRRLPRSQARERLLSVVVEQLPAREKEAAVAPVISREASEHEERQVPIIEDAATRRVPLFMRYYTASRRQQSERYVSVHLVEVGPPTRFIATCHRNGDLRWFRVESIVHARLDDREAFRSCPDAEVSAFRMASLDGYKGGEPPILCSFFVREPESSWVANNLLEGMRVESQRGGIRVTIETSAILRLARFVVALGGAARAETEALAHEVAELAHGALHLAEGSPAILDGSHIPAQARSDV